MELPTPTTPSTKLQQLHEKQDNTLTKGMQQRVRVTPLTAVHAQDNTVLDLAAMLKALQITNGTCKRNDTGCQAC